MKASLKPAPVSEVPEQAAGSPARDGQLWKPRPARCTPVALPLDEELSKANLFLPAYRVEGFCQQGDGSSCAGAAEMDLYAVRLEEVPLALLEDAACAGVLDEADIARAWRYRFPADRRRSLASSLLKRCALSLFECRRPSAWRFDRGRWGRPEIARDGREDGTPGRGLSFNVSHSGDLLVCAISRSGAAGIDVEEMVAPLDLSGLIVAMLHPEELADLRRIPLLHRGVPFLGYWTLKEAFLKATGEGMSREPRDLHFRGLVQGEVELVDLEEQGWRFTNCCFFDRYIVSTAFHRRA